MAIEEHRNAQGERPAPVPFLTLHGFMGVRQTFLCSVFSNGVSSAQTGVLTASDCAPFLIPSQQVTQP